MPTSYEFVVETSDKDGDIIDTQPYETLTKAIEHFYSEEPEPGGKVEMCVCYITGNDLDGETDRQYLYREEDGEWPAHFDGGHYIPQRLARLLPKIPAARHG